MLVWVDLEGGGWCKEARQKREFKTRPLKLAPMTANIMKRYGEREKYRKETDENENCKINDIWSHFLRGLPCCADLKLHGVIWWLKFPLAEEVFCDERFWHTVSSTMGVYKPRPKEGPIMVKKITSVLSCTINTVLYYWICPSLEQNNPGYMVAFQKR